MRGPPRKRTARSPAWAATLGSSVPRCRHSPMRWRGCWRFNAGFGAVGRSPNPSGGRACAITPGRSWTSASTPSDRATCFRCWRRSGTRNAKPHEGYASASARSCGGRWRRGIARTTPWMRSGRRCRRTRSGGNITRRCRTRRSARRFARFARRTHTSPPGLRWNS